MEPNPWVLVTADAGGLTAEFAFGGTEPAVARFLGRVEDSGDTTLVRVSKERHPELGNGLVLRMFLPHSFKQEQAIAKVYELNHAETHEHTLSYFMGAWHMASLVETGSEDATARLIAHRTERTEAVGMIAESIEDSPSVYLCFTTFLPAAVLQHSDVIKPFIWSMAGRSRWVKQHLSWH
jgi:hypothetical protein